MAITKKMIEDIKKSMLDAGKAERSFTTRQLVHELAPLIQAEINAGAKMMELYAIVKKGLPGDIPFSASTFTKYLRKALAALKSGTTSVE